MVHGIDAPESSQTCLDDAGQKWRCGQGAALAPQDLIGGRTITCDERDVDRYGPSIGRCLVGGLDLQRVARGSGFGSGLQEYSDNAAEGEARGSAE
jgi:endonuclease YncB( thermonuclease family)